MDRRRVSIHPYLRRALRSVSVSLAATEASRLDGFGQFKEFFGLSRKIAIPLLEWMDREGVTKRIGDVRKVL